MNKKEASIRMVELEINNNINLILILQYQKKRNSLKTKNIKNI
jgi:hypothetical protein